MTGHLITECRDYLPALIMENLSYTHHLCVYLKHCIIFDNGGLKMTVLMVIFSIIMIIGGVGCMFTPVETFSVLGWLMGFSIIVAGISAVLRYAAGKSNRSIWELIGGIVGIIVGLFITINGFAQFAANMIIAYVAAVWIILYGINDIIESVKLKKFNKTLPDEFRTGNWLLVMILGILTVVAGIICIFQPGITAISLGLLVGVSIFISGIKTLVLAIQIAKYN